MHKYEPGADLLFHGAKAKILELLQHKEGEVPHYLVEVTRKREKPEQHHIAESNLALPETED